VIIDEAQTVFRSMQKVEPGLLRWLETHRHYGVDILLMSQDFRQMSQGVTRLIEATVKFRKLAFVGLSKKYQGKVRGNPEDHEVIRAFVGPIRRRSTPTIRVMPRRRFEKRKRSHTVFKSARVAIGIAAGLFALAHGLAALVVPVHSPLPPDQRLCRPRPSGPRLASGSLLNPLGMSPSPSRDSAATQATGAHPRRRKRANRQGWRYLLDSGEILTAAQITGRYGVSVSEVYEDGSMRLIGEGVFYGPAGD
jgi:hypothetical protein